MAGALSTEERTETCKIGLHVHCVGVPLGWHLYCNQDHSTVPQSVILSMIHSVDFTP